MKFNYAKLLGRIKERGLTQEKLAQIIGINKGTLSAKLNNQYAFTAEEIDSISETLDIPNAEIGKYFFCR